MILRLGFFVAVATSACRSGPDSHPVYPTVVKSAQGTTEQDARGGLRLVDSEGDWYVTGLSEDAAGMVEQGRLFAALQSIKGTPDLRAFAILKTIGPAVGTSVQVAPQCVTPHSTLVPAARVKPLISNSDEKVGPCLARVVEVGTSERGEAYVILNVGAGVGVEPGDQYILLGRAVVAEGITPLGLDTDHDGLCQVPADPMYLKPSTARCMVVKYPDGRKELKNGFATWMTR